VDDDDRLREVVGEYLHGCGYAVLKARDGKEGIEMADACSGLIEVVISDIVMPKIHGGGLLNHLSKTRPETRILIISGHADDAAVNHGIHLETTSFLQKPFNFQTLGVKLHALMERPVARN